MAKILMVGEDLGVRAAVGAALRGTARRGVGVSTLILLPARFDSVSLAVRPLAIHCVHLSSWLPDQADGNARTQTEKRFLN